jgi:DNA-binding NarL/FixJ family response regulator
MPDLNGLEATRQIRQLAPKTEVLILTAHESEQLVHEVLSAGAKGYVLKSDAGNLLITAVEQLLKHKSFFSSQISEIVLKAYLAPPGTGGVEPPGAAHLTRREREVVQLIAEGKSTKEIAGVLGISVETAETHRSNLMRKMKFHSAADVVRYAIRNQMIQP